VTLLHKCVNRRNDRSKPGNVESPGNNHDESGRFDSHSGRNGCNGNKSRGSRENGIRGANDVVETGTDSNNLYR
jgi:hypothetical protein